MKILLLPLSVVALSGLVFQICPAQPSTAYHDRSRSSITTPVETLPLDKAISNLFEDGKSNVFADLTQLPYDPKNPTGLRDPSVKSKQNTVLSFAGRRSMKVDVVGERTLLFRRRPDVHRLLNLILAEQKRIDAEYPFDEKAIIAKVKAFYAERYGWNPTPANIAEQEKSAKGVDGSLRLSDFPSELRHQLEGALIHEVRDTTHGAYYRYFDRSNWGEARVRMEKWSDSHVIGEVPFRNTYAITLYPAKNMPYLPVGLPHLPRQARAESLLQNAHIILTSAPVETDVSAEPVKAPVSQAQNAPSVQTPVVSTRASFNIDSQSELQKQVSFNVVRIPLEKFVADLSKQADVTLALSPELAQGKELVARSAGMTLTEAMQSLAHLYIGHWDKEGQSYILNPDLLDELHLLMAQMGSGAYYGAYTPASFAQGGRDELGAHLADEIYNEVNAVELKSENGVAFTRLPDDLQERLIQLFRDEYGNDLIIMQKRIIDATSQDVRLAFAPLPPKQVPTFFGGAYTQAATFGTLGGQRAGLAAYTSDGRFISQILEGLHLDPPTTSQKEIQEQQKANHKWAVEHWLGPGEPPKDQDEPQAPKKDQ